MKRLSFLFTMVREGVSILWGILEKDLYKDTLALWQERVSPPSLFSPKDGDPREVTINSLLSFYDRKSSFHTFLYEGDLAYA